MGKINVLSTEISNKIAAGEVVERPASVVKELVENSIDAGADVITVEIKNGGISLIRVTDNGSGIAREDAGVAFLRHATSKISTSEDLEAIYTLGFRGEALSSIGAVSNVNLYTKRTEDAVGVCVSCHGGEISPCEDTGCPVGTTVEVRDLFFNTPARMKFLKRDQTEASYVSDLMVRYILAHPEISFKFISNGKQQFYSAGDNSLKNAVYTVYGKDYANAMVEVDYTIGNLRVKGVVGKGGIARPNRNFQSFFVNKRYIKSPLISSAVEKAYKNQVMTGKYPMAVLNIDIDSSMIDINVHPTKQEVKFSNESDVYTAVFHAVENALYSQHTIPEIRRTKPEPEPSFKADIVKSDAQYEISWEKKKDKWSPADEKVRYSEPVSEKKVEKPVPDSYKRDASPEYFEKRRNQILKEESEAQTTVLNMLLKEEPEVKNDFQKLKSKTPFADAILKANTAEKEEKTVVQVEEKPVEESVIEKVQLEKKSEEKQVAEIVAEKEKVITEVEEKPVKINNFKVIGQVFSTYIIVERDEEMLIIDQHAAHERLKYEEIKRELDKKSVSAQDLLIPVSVNLSPIEYVVFSDNQKFFEELGFEAEDFGDNSVIVRTAPAYVDYDDIDDLLCELIDKMQKEKGKPVSEKAEYAVYTIACKAAIKANHKLDMRELENLVEKIFEIEPINTCPHGRPIIISMTKKEIEKEFKRIL